VAVDFEARTAFGKLASAASAKVADGKVIGWFYQGSEEAVP
jgi:hypothetical protein